MSSGRKPLVKRMEEEFKYTVSGYYFTSPSLDVLAFGKYFSFGLCHSNISLVIKEYQTPADKRWAIGALDTKTRQNSFHYVLSAKMFETGSVPGKEDYFLLRAHYTTAKVHDTNYLGSVSDRKDYLKSHMILKSVLKISVPVMQPFGQVTHYLR